MTNSKPNTPNQTTLTNVQINQVIEQLKQDDSSLLQAYSEYASNNGYDSVYDNDDDSINMMFADSHDALRAAFYGDYNPSHAYFTFNGYGNLQSFEYLDSDNSPIDVEELSQWIVDNELFDEYNIEVTTLDDMLASIEDNINDDKYILSKLVSDLGVDIDLNSEYVIDDVMQEISSYNYESLTTIINHLNINYE